MAKDNRRVRHLRRVKRSNTLRGQQLDLQQAQMNQLVQMLVKQREELTTLKAAVESLAPTPEPSFTIQTLPDEGVTLADDSMVPADDNYYPADDLDDLSGVLTIEDRMRINALLEEETNDTVVNSNPS